MSVRVTYHSDGESSAYSVHFRRPAETYEAKNREAKDVESGGVGGPNIRSPINLKIRTSKSLRTLMAVAQQNGLAVRCIGYSFYERGRRQPLRFRGQNIF